MRLMISQPSTSAESANCSLEERTSQACSRIAGLSRNAIGTAFPEISSPRFESLGAFSRWGAMIMKFGYVPSRFSNQPPFLVPPKKSETHSRKQRPEMRERLFPCSRLSARTRQQDFQPGRSTQSCWRRGCRIRPARRYAIQRVHHQDRCGFVLGHRRGGSRKSQYRTRE
jgi:hypothetical protein